MSREKNSWHNLVYRDGKTLLRKVGAAKYKREY